MPGQRKQKTTILLANHQKVVRQGVRQMLEHEADFEVVGETDNAQEVVKLARELRPDIVVMEPRMPKLGVEAIRRVKAEHPQAAVLVLTMDDDEEYIVELLAAGAAGYLVKTVSSEQLVDAIRSVRAGEFVCNQAVMEKLSKHIARAHPVPLDLGQHLTPREAEVLKLMAKGMNNHDIASYLGLAERTVKGHVMNIFDKMDVGSRTEAVLEAVRRGWVRLEDE